MLNSTEMLRLVRAACNGDHLKFAQQIELLADSAEKAKPTAYTTNLRRLAESEREKGLAVNASLVPVDGLTEPLLPPDGTHKPVWDKTVRELLDGLVAEYKKLDVLTAHNLAPVIESYSLERPVRARPPLLPSCRRGLDWTVLFFVQTVLSAVSSVRR